MPDYDIVLVKVVVILGVMNRVPAATTKHNVFCYSAVTFGPRTYMSGSSRVRAPASKWGPFTTLCGYVCRGQQGKIERIHPPPTNSKYRLKSFCELGYANFRPNVFGAGKKISMEILVWVGLHAWCPVALKRFVAFSKNGNVQEIVGASSPIVVFPCEHIHCFCLERTGPASQIRCKNVCQWSSGQSGDKPTGWRDLATIKCDCRTVARNSSTRGLCIPIWQKFHWFTMFHISIWRGVWSIVWGAKDTNSVATLLLRKSTRFHDKKTLDSQKKH